MPAPIYHLGATAICSHGGQVTPLPTQTRVLVSGQAVIRMGDTGLTAGCAFTLPGPKPSPCLTTKWLLGAVRVSVQGQPVIIQTNLGDAFSPENAPQAKVSILVTQPRASAT
jgi:uncharacterized Zn-binding protein involved in type VI secretion